MKNEMDGRIMKKFIALRPNKFSYLSYLTDDDRVDKNKQRTEKCTIKCNFKINNHKMYLEKNEAILRLPQKNRQHDNQQYLRITDHPYRILIFEDSGSE